MKKLLTCIGCAGVALLTFAGTSSAALVLELNAANNPGAPGSAVWKNTAAAGVGGEYSHHPPAGGAGHAGVPPGYFTDGGVTFYSTSAARIDPVTGNGATGAWGLAQKQGWVGEFPGPTGNEPQFGVADFSIEIWMRRLGGLNGSEGQIFGMRGAKGTTGTPPYAGPEDQVTHHFNIFVKADNSDPDDNDRQLDVIMGHNPTLTQNVSVAKVDLLAVPTNNDLVNPLPFDQYVFTWDNTSSDLGIYVNGSLASLLGESNPVHMEHATLGPILMDASVIMDNLSIFKTGAENADNRTFNGDISLIRIYDTIIGDSTIAANLALGPNTNVPEPGTLALLGIGGLLLAALRRRE